MPEKPETIPEEAEIQAVASLVGRILADLRVELKLGLIVDVELVKDGEVVRGLGRIGEAIEGVHQGTARIRFRTTFFPNRHLFFVDSVFPRDARAPAFAGFRVRGTVQSEATGLTEAKHSAWAVKWNDREWAKWL